MRRLVGWSAFLLVVAVVAVGVLWWQNAGPGPVEPATVDFTNLDADQLATLLERGHAVARAGDCAACHQSQDGLDYAGGYAMHLPMGTIYGTNITPSLEYGIGRWTADDLWQAMVWGLRVDGANLYPAMPYASYRRVDRADVDALWLYLMSQPAVEKPNRDPEMPFPFNIRPAITFWNMAFLPEDRSLPRIDGKSDAWARGRYLVDVLGHCGECHTPRNLAFAKTDRHLQGEVLEGALAPDITAANLARRGWTDADLASFLKTGMSKQGVAALTMWPVIQHSTQHLPAADLRAIATYLMDGAPTTAPIVASADLPQDGAKQYLGLCAGCHGVNGEGQPHASPPLDSNTTAMLRDPGNLVRIIAEGIPAHAFPGEARMQAMPAYGDRMSAAEMAALVNYMRQRWGGLPGGVTESDVVRLLNERR